MKEVLRNQYHAVEARSLFLNYQVREGAAEIEHSRGDKGPPDAGYLRLKWQAEKKLAVLRHAVEKLRAAA